MRIKKIKFGKGNKISIGYEVLNTSTNTWDEYSMTCSDAPRPEFKEALQGLNVHVVDLCELPGSYTSRIKVTGVTFSYGGEAEVMGATITSQMKLSNSNCDLNLNTPHKASGSYNEYEVAPELLLTDDCIDALDHLCDEIELYVQSERAQTTLFAVQ